MNQQTPTARIDRPRYRWYLLTVLTGIYASHAMDRAVTSVILQPIKLEFGLTDGQTGALGGLTHGIAFCLAVLPLGWLSDRVNRRNLLSTLLAVWSAITFIAGFAQNFVTLLAVRFFVGGAEAGASPLSMSLISDVFPPRQRATAIGVLYLGLAVGQGGVRSPGRCRNCSPKDGGNGSASSPR